MKTDCDKCGGSGWCWRSEVDPDGWHELQMSSYGDDTHYACPDCDGKGFLESEESGARGIEHA